MAVSLNNAGNAILYNAVPWSHRLISLKTRSFPKGSVPKHLMQYLFKKGGVPATCARETANKSGAARVHAMNSCVSTALRKR
ncbi:MAG TPA: hypothetical protein VMW37_04830 [Dehalococcoidales bacterium]|nr:hypothetical protein [Dehalococcoidales bacterium]